MLISSISALPALQIYFVPGFFSQADWTKWSSYDGILNVRRRVTQTFVFHAFHLPLYDLQWNSAWSMDANDITTATDTAYMARIGSSRSYLPGVSVRAPPTRLVSSPR